MRLNTGPLLRDEHLFPPADRTAPPVRTMKKILPSAGARFVDVYKRQAREYHKLLPWYPQRDIFQIALSGAGDDDIFHGGSFVLICAWVSLG